MRKEDVKKGSIYELDGVVPLKEALPLGIQHVLAMFLGNISPLLIIAGMLGLSPDLKSAFIQMQIFPKNLVHSRTRILFLPVKQNIRLTAGTLYV